MTKVLLLTKIQLLGFLGLNRIRYGTGKERTKIILFGLLYLLLGAIMAFYSFLMAWGYSAIGLISYLPSVLVMACSVVTLFFTVMKANGTLFALKDHDTVMSLPVGVPQVIASRLLAVYLSDIAFCAVILIPALVVFALETGAGALIWLSGLVVLLCAPLLPMITGMILGAIITAISVRLRHKNLFIILFGFVGLIAIMALSFGLQSVSVEQLTDLGATIGRVTARAYPPSVFVTSALNNSDFVGLSLFVAVSILPAALFIALLARVYSGINSALFVRGAKGGYRMGVLRASSPLMALFRKELGRLVSSPIYIINTCFGYVLLPILSIMLIVVPISTLEQALGVPGISGMLDSLRPIAPFFPVFFLIMTSTTCVSFNIEGKNRWILATLPVHQSTIYNAKILVSLAVSVPSILISGTALCFFFGANPLDAFLLYAVPLSYILFISVAGLRINLAFPKYDWNSEQQAVKQSASAIVTLCAGIATVAIPFVPLLYFPQAFLVVYAATIILMLALTGITYAFLCRIRLYF